MPYKNPEAIKAAKKAWYERNKKEVTRKARDARTIRNKFVRDYKLENSNCSECGISYPPHILDFDHISGIKKAGISQLVRNGTLNQIKDEISKCEVVCANCHRHRTYMRSVQTV